MKKIFQNVLITVGTTQFDLLIETILLPETISALNKLDCRKLTIQYGKFQDLDTLNLFRLIKNIEIELFDYTKSLNEYIQQADLVISHAGAGTSLEVLRLKRPLLIVINRKLMNNHQIELAEELKKQKYAEYTFPENLAKDLLKFNAKKFLTFPQKNQKLFSDFIEKEIFS